MSELHNKIIIITGASGGLGAEMVKSFLKESSLLILTDLYQTSLDILEKECRELNDKKGRILGSIALDLTKPSAPEELIHFAVSFGSPDILINNAGIAALGKFSETPSDKWEKIIQLNLLAPMRTTHVLLPYLISKKSGHIVNISSVAGIVASPGLVSYSSSKFGIRAFGEALYKEVSEHGIKVTNLYPFFTKTAILDSEQFGLKEKRKLPEFILSEPKEVIDELIHGIKNNSLHVYPGLIAKTMDFLSRVTPWIFQDMAKGVLH